MITMEYEARNLPNRMSISDRGFVSRNSIVPASNSSAKLLIVIAGTNNNITSGPSSNSLYRSA